MIFHVEIPNNQVLSLWKILPNYRNTDLFQNEIPLFKYWIFRINACLCPNTPRMSELTAKCLPMEASRQVEKAACNDLKNLSQQDPAHFSCGPAELGRGRRYETSNPKTGNPQTDNLTTRVPHRARDSLFLLVFLFPTSVHTKRESVGFLMFKECRKRQDFTGFPRFPYLFRI
jgi:hypothetical protein